MAGKITGLLLGSVLLSIFFLKNIDANEHEAVIMYREPDEKENHYYEAPQVRLRLESGDGILKYRITNQRGAVMGEVIGIGNEVVIGAEKLVEGNNDLEFWIEKEGDTIANTYSSKSFYITGTSIEQYEEPQELKEIYEGAMSMEVKEAEVKENDKEAIEEKSLQIIVDNKKPKIRTPIKYRKSSLKSFVVKEDEIVVEDETQTLVILKLDGVVYKRGTVIKKSGRHLLEIWARDLAGNESRKTFSIIIT